MRPRLFIACLIVLLATATALLVLPAKQDTHTASDPQKQIATLVTDMANALNDADQTTYLSLYGRSPSDQQTRKVQEFFADLPKDFSVALTLQSVEMQNEDHAVARVLYETQEGASPSQSSERTLPLRLLDQRWVLI